MNRVVGVFDGDSALWRVAVGACLIMPAGLLYGRTIADGLTCGIGVLFLTDCAYRREWTWLGSTWVRLAAALWVWMLFCSIVTGNVHEIVQSAVSIRLLLLSAALEHWVLRRAETRRHLQWVVLGVAVWVAAQCWQQYVTGTNFLGYPRWGDGALTGPFFRPRAGPTYLALFFPAFLPGLVRILTEPGFRRGVIGLVLFAVAAATMVIIGQRMPTLLLFFGLLLCALLIRPLRLPIVAVIAVGAVTIALTPIISPPTYAKLVVKFTDQMTHFWQSPYGLLFARATVMVGRHPWLGMGFDGFRDFCGDPLYDNGLPWLHIPPGGAANADSCNIHPHNYYLLVATNSGLPGLGLFVALVICWIRRIGRDLQPIAEPRRAALFVIVLTSLWPIASTTTLFAFPNAGWFFLTIGWALAEARAPGGSEREYQERGGMIVTTKPTGRAAWPQNT